MEDICRGCFYAARLSEMWVCDYLSKTGHRRPCLPGKGCTARIEVEQDRKRAWKGRSVMKKRTWDAERARALYDEGWTDARISAEVGVKPSAVAFWRRGLKLPANSEHRPPPETGAESVPEKQPPAALRPEAAPAGENSPLTLRALTGPVSFSVELHGCALTLRAPDLEGAVWMHKYAGQLLKELPAKLEKGVSPYRQNSK